MKCRSASAVQSSKYPTWRRLQEHEEQTGQLYYQVLRYRSKHPQETPSKWRKLCRRNAAPSAPSPPHPSATRFSAHARLLIEEAALVALSLGADSLDDIEQELAELQLLRYCQPLRQAYGCS